MNSIPKPLNDILNADPYYLKCCLRMLGGCSGRIERHHALIYAGRQYQAKFCIVPACHYHHDLARRSDIKERFDWVLLNRATDDEIRAISKAIDYRVVRDRLNTKFGIYTTL